MARLNSLLGVTFIHFISQLKVIGARLLRKKKETTTQSEKQRKKGDRKKERGRKNRNEYSGHLANAVVSRLLFCFSLRLRPRRFRFTQYRLWSSFPRAVGSFLNKKPKEKEREGKEKEK